MSGVLSLCCCPKERLSVHKTIQRGHKDRGKTSCFPGVASWGEFLVHRQHSVRTLPFLSASPFFRKAIRVSFQSAFSFLSVKEAKINITLHKRSFLGGILFGYFGVINPGDEARSEVKPANKCKSMSLQISVIEFFI